MIVFYHLQVHITLTTIKYFWSICNRIRCCKLFELSMEIDAKQTASSMSSCSFSWILTWCQFLKYCAWANISSILYLLDYWCVLDNNFVQNVASYSGSLWSLYSGHDHAWVSLTTWNCLNFSTVEHHQTCKMTLQKLLLENFK